MSENKRILEVCTGSLQSVINAVEGGAERIELCSALPLDGLTPSIGLLKEVREMFPQLKVHVLIRPREGDSQERRARRMTKLNGTVRQGYAIRSPKERMGRGV